MPNLKSFLLIAFAGTALLGSLAHAGRRNRVPVPLDHCARLVLQQSGALANSTPPSRAEVGSTGIYIRPEFIVGVNGQRLQNLRPKLSLEWGAGRVTSIESFSVQRKRVIAATSEREIGLAFFDSRGKKVSQLNELHIRNGFGWSPDIIARSHETHFLVTAGGQTPFRLIDVKEQADAGPLQPPNSTKLGNHSVWFFNQGTRLVVLNSDWTLSIYQLDKLRRRFSYSHELTLGLHTIFGFSRITSEIWSTEIDLEKRRMWIAHEEGVFRFSLSEDLTAPNKELSADRWIRAYHPITAMKLDPTANWLWLASEEFSHFPTRMEYRKAAPSRVSLFRSDASSGEIDIKEEGVLSGSHVNELHVSSKAIALIMNAPQSAIALFNDEGRPTARWLFERCSDRRYLSSTSGPFDPIHSSALSPSRRYMATGHDGGAVGVWDLHTEKIVAVFDTKLVDLRGLSFSPDENELLVSGHFGLAKVYSLTGRGSHGGGLLNPAPQPQGLAAPGR